jgi:hypothetical protein
VLEADDVAIDSFVAATTIDSDDMRRGWVGAAAAGLDVATVTAQARLALNERGDDDKHEILHLVTALGPGPHPMTDASRLGIDEHEALVAALGATSDSKAHSAFEIPLGSRGGQLRERLLGLPAKRRRLAALLACCAADDPAKAAAQLAATPAGQPCCPRWRQPLPQTAASAQRTGSKSAHPGPCNRRPHHPSGRQAGSAAGRRRPTREPLVMSAVRQLQRPADVDCRHCDSVTRPSYD